jgi:hypothetical protein
MIKRLEKLKKVDNQVYFLLSALLFFSFKCFFVVVFVFVFMFSLTSELYSFVSLTFSLS